MPQEDFLYCTPSVFVIGDEYEILINLREFGICFLKIGFQIMQISAEEQRAISYAPKWTHLPPKKPPPPDAARTSHIENAARCRRLRWQ